MLHEYDKILLDSHLTLEFVVPYGLTSQYLSQCLSRLGEVNTCSIIRRRTSDPSQCIAHVSFFKATSFFRGLNYLNGRPYDTSAILIFKNTDGSWSQTTIPQFSPTEPILVLSYPQEVSIRNILDFFSPFQPSKHEPILFENEELPIQVKISFDCFFSAKMALEALSDANFLIQNGSVTVRGFIQPKPTESLGLGFNSREIIEPSISPRRQRSPSPVSENFFDEPEYPRQKRRSPSRSRDRSVPISRSKHGRDRFYR
ncbi:hypothetical protein RCL1_003605 [Eukaryota sp. TZLM3-RCL]